MLSTQRFSNRVEDYVKYRPSYPAAILTALTDAGILSNESVIADVGSGTGLLAQLFLSHGNHVIGVEPNPEMRAAGEETLKSFGAHFVSINGTAEATALPNQSVDLITAGQAFHWFDREKTKAEFRRILRGSRWVALVWNERLVHASAFLEGYETLLKDFSTDYTKIDHRQITPDILAVFFDTPVKTYTFPNCQTFDFAGLQGRLLSSSYAPAKGHPRHETMLEALRKLFDAHQVSGKVNFEYETQMHTGQLV